MVPDTIFSCGRFHGITQTFSTNITQIMGSPFFTLEIPWHHHTVRGRGGYHRGKYAKNVAFSRFTTWNRVSDSMGEATVSHRIGGKECPYRNMESNVPSSMTAIHTESDYM